jgi:hypothetical protein
VRFVLLSSAPEARKVFSAWEGIRAPRKTNNRTTAGEAVRTCLARGQEQAFAGGKEHFTSPWCWVTFGEQSMVISRERRSATATIMYVGTGFHGLCWVNPGSFKVPPKRVKTVLDEEGQLRFRS